MLDDTVPDFAETSGGGILESIFTRESEDAQVVTVHGYGIKVLICDGQLVIADGIGKHRRERKYPKIDRTVRRLVITGPDGYVTLDALQWCAEHGITVAMMSPDAELTAHYATSDRVTDARMLRTQAMAGIDGPLAYKGMEVAAELLSRKLTGQSANLVKLLDAQRASDRITAYAQQIPDSDSIKALEDLERWAAKVYFEAWSDTVAVPWHDRDRKRIPVNWLTFRTRKNSALAANKQRAAADPVNAMLNYGYGIGVAVCKAACIGHGLSPAMGFMHTDKPGRDSLAMDVLEAVRPEIDAYILGLLGFGSMPRDFTFRDFAEPYGYAPGTVRVVAPLTHQISEQAMNWQRVADSAAAEVAGILSAPAGRRSSKSHMLKMRKAEFQSAEIDIASIVPDDDWQRIQSLLPPARNGSKGFAGIDNRIIIAAMVYLERHHKPWAHVPTAFGVARRTLENRRQSWSISGHWPEIQAAIEELASVPERKPADPEHSP